MWAQALPAASLLLAPGRGGEPGELPLKPLALGLALREGGLHVGELPRQQVLLQLELDIHVGDPARDRFEGVALAGDALVERAAGLDDRIEDALEALGEAVDRQAAADEVLDTQWIV